MPFCQERQSLKGQSQGNLKMAKQAFKLTQKGNMFLVRDLDGQVSGWEASAYSSQMTRNSDCYRNPTPPFAIATPTYKLSSHGRRQLWLSSTRVMQNFHWMPFRWSISYVQNIRLNILSQNEGSSYTKSAFFINSQALASVFTLITVHM